MYSYQIKVEETQEIPNRTILRVGFNRILPASGDRLVKDALEQVEQKIDSGELSQGGVLLIDGPQSVPIAHLLGHKLAHLYEIIAVLDPKIGRKGYKTYIVTSNHGSPDYQIGDTIETEEPQSEKNKIKVVLCGPPQSGKSCLRDGLKRAILENLGAPYPYVITACPDGEGSWYQQTYKNNQESAKQIKPRHKGDVTSEFAQQAAQWVRSANQIINIIDVGGKISAENELIMQEATHSVVIAGDSGKFKEWEEFCRSLNLQVIATIESQLEAQQDKVFLPSDWQNNTNEKLKTSPLLTGIVHRLARGEDVSTRPMIKALADLLIHLTSGS